MRINVYFILIFLIFGNSRIVGQIQFKPEIDSNSKAVTRLFKAQKGDEALILSNKLIAQNPSIGINYFNRAVIKYYKQTKIEKTSLEYSKGKEIIEDIKRAKQNDYFNPELYYLLFSVSYNCDPGNERIFGCFTDPFLYNEHIRYKQLKAIIDTAIDLRKFNEKYLWARVTLMDEYDITSWPAFDAYKEDIPTFRFDCQLILELTKSKRRKFLAYYHLANAYKSYYLDTLKAIQYFSAAIEIDSTFGFPYAERGKLRVRYHDNCPDAIQDFTSSLKRFKAPDIFYERALCYIATTENSSALTDLNSSIALYEGERSEILASNSIPLKLEFQQRKLGDVYYARGLVNFDLKNDTEALKDFTKAIEYGKKEASAPKKDLLEYMALEKNNQSNIENLNSAYSVPMIKKGDIYEVAVVINSSLKLNFIFDPGASDVSISPDVALTLIRTGTVTDKDFIGTKTYVIGK